MEPELQTTFAPAPGSAAALIQELSIVLYVGSALIFVLVIALLLRAVFTGERQVNARRWVVGGGIVFPAVTLTLLLVYSLAVGSTVANFNAEGPLRFLLDCISSGARALASPIPSAGNMRIEVVAHQWWWEVRYLDRNPAAPPIVLANELHLPVGRAVEVYISTPDVIHSFWVPTLAGKMDAIPGRRTRLVLQSDEPGVHRGQCAEYCGGQHALMAFHVVVEPEDEFRGWLARQAQAVAVPRDAQLRAGFEAFMRGGCGECHSVRGTAAAGTSGPDLTHVGSRRTLAAGALRNHVGTMAGWIAGPQDIKPGTTMPPARDYDGRELRAVAKWLGSLE